jgi:hypothetical protein
VVFDEVGALGGGSPGFLRLFAVVATEFVDFFGDSGELLDVVLDGAVIVGVGEQYVFEF